MTSRSRTTDTAPGRIPRVAVVTVTFNAAPFIEPFLIAVKDLHYPQLEVVIVDNASHDETTGLIARLLPRAVLIRSPRNLGFAAACNLGAECAGGDVLLFLNPDTRPPPDAVEALCATIWHSPEIGAAGSKLVFPDGRIQRIGGALGPNGIASHPGWGEPDRGQYDRPADVDYVPGAALAIRRSLFLALGGFHTGYFPGFYEDTELCLRLRERGLRVCYVPTPRIAHLESPSMGRRTAYWLHRNRMLFLARNPSARAGIGREIRWLSATHVMPIVRALVGGHPRSFAREARLLAGVIAGMAAGGLAVLRARRGGRILSRPPHLPAGVASG
ncbi:MAG TPA: glycosyltransferase family 2 protein [Candidatus Binatia bacterium]|nr:glycosyltransferase family 2 protein [Candidatus Binatia bacterium]